MEILQYVPDVSVTIIAAVAIWRFMVLEMKRKDDRIDRLERRVDELHDDIRAGFSCHYPGDSTSVTINVPTETTP